MKKRMYQTAMDGKVDLDDPAIYEYLPKTIKELDNLMFKEIGYALVYMDYFPSRKGMFPKNDMQRQRVYKLIQRFAEDRKSNYDNIQWYREQVFLFQDETENMC